MELSDSNAAAIDSQPAATTAGGIFGSVMSLLNSPEIGGIAGLLEKFNQAGLGEQVASWIGHGDNLPITGAQLETVLGTSVIKTIAGKMGIDSTMVAGTLAGMLPHLVNQMTPGGELPAGGSEISQLLSGLFGSKPA